ncbi:endonuclease/exonuclease/phosphatase family protein [Candidatus Thiodictyon syntrophicum]|jgi:endonuclease/exonuclease/phosphatase family metal-dependent hydrolase|uniref:Endonuclease n=1 Tax=Candidatus Thiodictyon syntrophicum TaxID=1166950 RepID=A0A2K8UA81_9GAMM|nr:endonuclease/exonuclease/phosphatase family protein [Candidatus Thiodictyon syntrophicum]AUB82490.1 endonuclease [Candidatus Thiodictyon syntrophicum]
MQQIKLLSYNVQGGIYSRKYSDYVTNSWKHLLPHPERLVNLTRIAQLIQQFDVVGVQEVDAGSLRSANVDQIQYLARQAAFPYWYHQVNRDLGPFAQHSNGLLSRLRPGPVTEHKLPGLPGRGAVVAELPLADGGHLGVGIVHLALGWRARKRQLDYLAEVAQAHPLLVLMGDFNCDCDSRSLRAMVRRTGMQGLNRELKTFPSWRPRRTLDHILVSAPLRIVSAHVIDYPLSDHLPRSMTLALPAGRHFAEPAQLRGQAFNPVRKSDASPSRTRR